jgi:hypothetical protein
MIDPPYGIAKETWDSTRWGYDHFDSIFKKISAIDQRKMVFVITFGTIETIYDFSRAAKVFFYLLYFYNY